MGIASHVHSSDFGSPFSSFSGQRERFSLRVLDACEVSPVIVSDATMAGVHFVTGLPEGRTRRLMRERKINGSNHYHPTFYLAGSSFLVHHLERKSFP